MASSLGRLSTSVEAVQSDAEHLREEGNNMYSAGQYEEAIRKYMFSARKSRETHQTDGEMKAWCNISLSYLKLNKPGEAIEFAEKAVRLDSRNAKAHYRRAQALAELECPEDCVKDYITSYELKPNRKTFFNAVKTAVKHGCKIRGMSLTTKHQAFLQEIDHTSCGPYLETEIQELSLQCIRERKFGVIPLLKFMLKAEISCSAILKGITNRLPESEDDVYEMVFSIKSHTDYLKESGDVTMLKVMNAKLICEAITQDKLQVAEFFIDELEIQVDAIDISKLLKNTNLRFEHDLLQKMLRRGAGLDKCENNPLKVVLSLHYEQPVTKLKMIRVLVEYGVCVNIDLPNTTIIHEVVSIVLKCEHDDKMDTLRLVCEKFDFNSVICNKDDQTPWHLALSAKRSQKSIQICKILSKFPINPSQKDKNGKRADFHKNENDARVILLKKKEAEMKEKEGVEKGGEMQRKKREKKKGNVLTQEDTPHSVIQETLLESEKTDSVTEHITEVKSVAEDPAPVTIDEDTIKETTEEITQKLKQHLERLHKHDDEYFHIPTQCKRKDKPLPTTSPAMTTVNCPPLRKENEPKDEQNALESPSQDLSLDFDNQTWSIECTDKVVKILSGRKHRYIKQRFLEKMMMLAGGDFLGNIKHSKRVSVKQGLELYETRLTDSGRIIWQIAIQFLPPSKAQSACGNKYFFTEIIRVWDIVLDHDKIHQCVANIEKNVYDRGCQASLLVKSNLKCEETGSSIKGNKRSPKTFVLVKTDGTIKEQDVVFIPPIHSEENMYTIAPLYSLSTHMVKHMLEGGDMEKAFPYKEWPQEHDIINMGNKEAILLLGRSGTGKTTCCLYRMWNEFKHYWRDYADVEFDSIPKRQISLSDTENEVCEEEQSDSKPCETHATMNGHNLTENGEECELPIGIEDQTNEPPADLREDVHKPDYMQSVGEHPTDIEGHTIASEIGTKDDRIKYDHLHQVFVTKNYVLCNRLRKQFYRFAVTETCAKSHIQIKDEELPHDLVDMRDLSYPLFLTARQFYVLLDYSMHDDEYYFRRDKKGRMMETILSSDYDHEDVDTLYDLEDSDDEDGVFHQLYPTYKGQHLLRRREVTASYYEDTIWPKNPNETGGMSSLMVWMEIKSFIKGSREAIESEAGYLSEKEYNDVGKKAAPNFAGNRQVVYKLFLDYEQYIQNHRNEHLFDECDIVHNIFQRLQKQRRKLEWALHSIYIDEVQDFTQGELWLMLHNCRDPNGFFLTGDTAQSIMSGISFRFEDVKTLFYHLKEQHAFDKVRIVVPKVQHLNTNFRSHSGILRLAASVTDVLKEFFPDSFDHKNLPREEGLVPGPKPFIFDSCSATDLAIVLAGNKRTCSSIDFGAHQAVLVRTQGAKQDLPNDLTSAIVLTIFESKGLEFDDVLLYNFFTDSKLLEEWRTLISFCDKNPRRSDEDKSESSKIVCKKPHPLEFVKEKHKQLSSELKHLYTAITRTKTKLWLYESGDKHQSALYYWQQYDNLVEVVVELTQRSGEIFATSSTSEDWIARGDEFVQKKLWKVARRCYQKASCVSKVKECDAFMHCQNARKSTKQNAEKQDLYKKAATAFLECDEIEHTPKALEKATICLFNGKMYDAAAQLFRRMKKFDDAFKCYFKAKKLEQCVEVREAQQRYQDAVLFLFQYNKTHAVQLASKYIRQKLCSLNDIDPKIIRHGKQLISESGDTTKLLTVIDCIPQILQVECLKKVQAYDRATAILKSVGENEDAYKLMLTQAMYCEAFDLAKELSDTNKVHETLLQATKSRLTQYPHMPVCHTEVPELQTELAQVCQSDNVLSSVKAMACLLLSMLTKDGQPCQEALKLFRQDNNALGECEAFAVLARLSGVKKDIKYVEMMVKACDGAKEICNILKFKSHTKTANFMNVIQQVEDFYGFTKGKKEYLISLHQDVWSLCRERGSSECQTSMHLKPTIVYEVVCCHLEAIITQTMEKETQKTVQHSLEQFQFHQKLIERRFNYTQLKLCEYLKAYSLGLEIKWHLHSTEFETWIRGFLDLFTVSALVYLKLDEKHFEIVRRFPGVAETMKKKINSILDKPIHFLGMNDWMKVWLLSHVLTAEDGELKRTTNTRPKGALSKSESHFYVKNVPHFHKWVQSCQLLRQGTKALLAIRILLSYIEIVARRRSLHQTITGTDAVFMIGVSTMVLYCFLASSLPRGASIVVPQVVVDMMECFDRVNCQKKGDKHIFQSCFDTLKLIDANMVKDTAVNGIQRTLQVFTGAYEEKFNVLQRATNLKQGNSAVTGIILGLTLLGNMSLSNLYKPSDLLDYQTRIWHTLQSITEHPNLRRICERFSYCTSSRALFALVQQLNQIHYEVHSGSISDLFLIVLTKTGYQLNPTYLRRLPENSVIPLQFIKPTPNCEPFLSSDQEEVREEQQQLHEDLTNSAQPNENDMDLSRLDSHSSNEDDIDEELEVLGLEVDDEEGLVQSTVERQISVDETVTDKDFCHACGIKLKANSSNDTSSTSQGQHIESEDHKRKKTEFDNFEKRYDSLSEQGNGWDDEIQKWETLDKSSNLEIVILDVKRQVKRLEDINTTTRKDRQWKEGEMKLQETSDKIQTLLEKGRQEQTKRSDHVSDVMMVHEQSEDEKEMSDVDYDEETPKQARRSRLKESRRNKL